MKFLIFLILLRSTCQGLAFRCLFDCVIAETSSEMYMLLVMRKYFFDIPSSGFSRAWFSPPLLECRGRVVKSDRADSHPSSKRLDILFFFLKRSIPKF